MLCFWNNGFVWKNKNWPCIVNRLLGTEFRVIVDREDQLELSFKITYDPAGKDAKNAAPMEIDQRYVWFTPSTLNSSNKLIKLMFIILKFLQISYGFSFKN